MGRIILMNDVEIRGLDRVSDSAEGGFRTALISLYDLENNAVRILAPVLRREGFFAMEIYFKDWKNNFFSPPTGRELENLIKLLRDNNITHASISLRASAYLKVATQLTRLIQEKLNIPVIWGGTHVILCPEESLQVADMICIGEGEYAFPELARRVRDGVDISDSPNMWIKRNGEVFRNPLLGLIQNLNELPFRDYTSPHKYVISGNTVVQGDPMIHDPVFQIITSRGCPYHCSYCYNSTLRKLYAGMGRYYRVRTVDSIIAELKQAKGIFGNLRRIKFDDEVFNFEEDWLEEFRVKYKKEIGLPFECFTEPKLVTMERFSRMKDAGLSIVYMGIQNSFRITEELYDRTVPEEKVKESAEIFHRLGLDARYQVILDDPLSTTEDKDRLFRLLMSFRRPFELYLFSLTVFPNTELSRKLLEQGLITEDQIEGKDTKTFRQLRVDLGYPRSPEDRYWAALLVLLTKRFIPKSLLWKFHESESLRRNPWPLVTLAQVSNLVKMGFVASGMLFRGELTWTAFKRWMNLRSMITQ